MKSDDEQAEDDAGVDFDRIRHLLESLSLSGTEARAMVALLRLGTANPVQLSSLCGISRSNLYPVLESLIAKGLCQRLPGRYALWVTPGPDEVLAILQAAEEARANAAREAVERQLVEARALLAKLPEYKRAESPIRLVDDVRLTIIYGQAMATVDTEILVLNRGPYAGDVVPSPEVLEALGRGAKARALYVSAELDAPDGGVRRCADAYANAGVDQRVVDSLPASMAVIGRETVLLSLPSLDESPVVPAHATAIRHEGMAELQTAAFEHLWASARPYPLSPMPAAGTTVVHSAPAESR